MKSPYLFLTVLCVWISMARRLTTVQKDNLSADLEIILDSNDATTVFQM